MPRTYFELQPIQSVSLVQWLIGLVLLSAVAVQLPAADKPTNLYGRRIALEANASKHAHDTAEALRKWLDKVTGKAFNITERSAGPGIFLVTENSSLLPQADLNPLRKTTSPEAFLISGDATRLWIVGKTDLGLDRGVHWYLDQLGCRWLLPSERWTIVPKRPDITLKIHSLQSPAFDLRNFAGTGYFGRPVIDPKQRMAAAWELYQRQNLLGGDIRLGGHVGEAFALKHKAEWLKHPEYLAETNGQRQVWTPNAIVKLCASNPGLQTLWVRNRVDDLRAQLKVNPRVRSVSVEPSDGGGHCECAACRKLGSVSDRVFTLANLAALEVQREFPGKFVNLYAYNEHAAPPNIAIEPNVIVSIVPYGFQRTGMAPEEFILAWEKKCGTLAMYDYWNIPDWSRNLPDMAPQSVVDKIRFWNKHHVKYFLAESTYCGGSMGLNWYLGTRLLWNPKQDEAAIIDDYFQQAFGPAQAPIRDMYGRWGADFILSDHELGLSFRDLRRAMALTNDAAIVARLVDLGRYVHVMGLWYEYLSAARQSPERIARGKAYVHALWRNYESNMLQVFRLAQLIDRDERPALNEINPDNPMWKDIPQFTDAEVLKQIDAGIARYQPLDFRPARFSSALVPLKEPTAPLSETVVESGLFGYSAGFVLVPPDNVTQVRIAIRVNAVSGPSKQDRVRVTDPAGTIVFDMKIDNTSKWRTLEIPTVKRGTYRVSVTDQKNSFYLRVPTNLPFVCTDAFTCADLSPRTYFYVPKGLSAIAVHSPGVIPLKIFKPDGTPVQVERNNQGKNVFLIDVGAGGDGQIWSFSQFKAWQPIRLLNCPNYFAFSPTGMMVPRDR